MPQFFPLNRRKFLHYSALAGTSSLLSLGLHGVAPQSTTFAQSSSVHSNKRLIVVLLRGAVDGLNVVVPYRDQYYYEARPTIAIPAAGRPGGVINLDGEFGLNPALADLMPFWQSKQLAFFHASGSPDPSRSHFDAQDFMETGTPGDKSTHDGWMNRLLSQLPRQSANQAVSIGGTTPRIFQGTAPVSSVEAGPRGLNQSQIDQEPIQAVFDQLYRGNDVLSQTYQQGRQSRDLLIASLDKEMMASARGAPTPGYMARNVPNLVKLLTGPSKAQLMVMSFGGWDTHRNQGSTSGQLSGNLKPLGEGLALLAKSLGSVFQDTMILVMSEFGRTVAENGNGGTDHGHGNVMWLLGGNFAGGQVYGDWPGLEPDSLYEGRDLAITTDFRNVIEQVLTGHLGLNSGAMASIFPNYSA
jgi:uncharacterized protein (DUF1501 family)